MCFLCGFFVCRFQMRQTKTVACERGNKGVYMGVQSVDHKASGKKDKEGEWSYV